MSARSSERISTPPPSPPPPPPPPPPYVSRSPTRAESSRTWATMPPAPMSSVSARSWAPRWTESRSIAISTCSTSRSSVAGARPRRQQVAAPSSSPSPAPRACPALATAAASWSMRWASDASFDSSSGSGTATPEPARSIAAGRERRDALFELLQASVQLGLDLEPRCDERTRFVPCLTRDLTLRTPPRRTWPSRRAGRSRRRSGSRASDRRCRVARERRRPAPRRAVARSR